MLLAFAAPAAAQPMNIGAYSMSVYNGGPGFRLGEAPLRLHVGASAEFGYDSNILYAPVAIAAGVLRLRVHLDLSTVSAEKSETETETEPPKIAFRFGSQFEYREYITDQDGVASGRNFNFFADGGLVVFPRGPYTLTLADWFARTADPLNFEISQNIVRDINRLGLLFTGRPRNGRLEFGIGDYFQLSYTGENPLFAFASYYGTEAQAFVRWYLLPKTRLSFVARGGYNYYPHNQSQNQAPLRVLAGFSSFFTNWLAGEVSVGYGNSFNFTGPSYNNFVGTASLRFFLPYHAAITVGYERDFFQSLIANYYYDDGVTLTYDQPLVYRLTAQVGGSVRYRRYEGLIDPALIRATSYSSTTHTGPIYEAHAELNAEATKWLHCGVSYRFLMDATDFVFIYGDRTVKDSYVKHSVFARLDFAY